MRRTLAVLVAGVLLVAGCTSTPAASSAHGSSGIGRGIRSATSAAPATAGTGEKDIITLRSGTGVVTGHPFFAMVEEYNRTHPNVEVKLEMYPWANDTTPLATTLAAGNPPDVTRQSIPGVAGSNALQSPLLVDVSQYLTPEEIADYGPDILGPPTIDGKMVLWPQDRDWGTALVANGKMLADAGVDVAKIQAEGWTFDEFRDAAKKLTVGDRYGFGFSNDYASSVFLELAWRAGVPDGNANMGPAFWGNKFSYDGAGLGPGPPADPRHDLRRQVDPVRGHRPQGAHAAAVVRQARDDQLLARRRRRDQGLQQRHRQGRGQGHPRGLPARAPALAV